MSEFLRSMSFREKSLWVETAIWLYLWIWYFGRVGGGLFDGSLTRGDTLSVFFTMTFIFIFLIVVSQITLAVISPREANAPTDERERLFNWRANSHSSYLLGGGVVAIAIHSMVNDVSAVVMVHELILLLVAVEILASALQILYLRRGQ